MRRSSGNDGEAEFGVVADHHISSVGALHQILGKYRRRVPGGQQLTTGQQRHRVAKLSGESQVVKRAYYRETVGLAERVNKFHGLLLVTKIECVRRLIEHEYARLLGQRPSNKCTLHLTSAETIDASIRELLQIETGENVFDDLSVNRSFASEWREMSRATKQDVIGHRHSLRKFGTLRHNGEDPSAFPRFHMANIDAINEEFTGVRHVSRHRRK